MYTYNIGYHTYEENDYIQLYHKKKFSKKEFAELIADVVSKIVGSTKERTTFQDILYSIAEELTKNYGFKRIKFAADFSVFGWADILDENDWKYDRDEQLKKLTRKIKKEKSSI